MNLAPPEHVLKVVARDYEQMRFMIFGARPDFRVTMAGLQALEVEITAFN